MNTGFKWLPPDKTPATKHGSSDNYIVAVKRKSSGKTYTFPACHLNAYPLEYDGDCICENEGDHSDGCPTSGWFGFDASNQYEAGLYTKLLDPGDELLAWAEIPQFKTE
jgi:hypothetical protein